ncbi:hypothetical protein SCHIN_v1c10040 [Spiroplasma chinense]|uniref:Uncharacterized protein n=1 Tax=Spiroplasma chinense TaxID=216932 RepID=A0A5B9Y7B3_9MOLU|nr:hypothetical protein [Spiroplasma chinense]QEH62197.1 hypothetical protein SCHIN_v1c10040 [Spiroplasma chinense]
MKKLLISLAAAGIAGGAVTPAVYAVMNNTRDDEEAPIHQREESFSYSLDIRAMLPENEIKYGEKIMISGGGEQDPLQKVIWKISDRAKELKSNKYELNAISSVLSGTNSGANGFAHVKSMNEVLQYNIVKVRRQWIQIDYRNNSISNEYNVRIGADFEVANQSSGPFINIDNVQLSSFAGFFPFKTVGEILKIFSNNLSMIYYIVIDISHIDSHADAGIEHTKLDAYLYVNQMLESLNGGGSGVKWREQILKYIQDLLDAQITSIDKFEKIYKAVDNGKGGYELGEQLAANYQLFHDTDPYFYVEVTSKKQAIGKFYLLIENYVAIEAITQ